MPVAKHKRSYRFLRGVVCAFSKKMKTVWEEPFDGQPSVFCPNHADAFGPIDMCAHFELRDQICPWYNADVADAKLVPAYVRQDYWWTPGCKLEPLYNATLPYLAAAVLPPIIRTVPGIQVHHSMKILQTFRQSIAAMKNGDSLVIFPQQPDGHESHLEKLNDGWLTLAPMVYKELGYPLRIYPVYIDHKGKTIYVRKPVTVDPAIRLNDQKEAILSVISKGLKP